MSSKSSLRNRGPLFALAFYLLSFAPALLLVAGSPAASGPDSKDDAPPPPGAAAARAATTPALERLKADLSYLADDAREGRAPGTKGIEAAAAYIATVFRDAGLKPAAGADGYFQPFAISGRPTLDGNPKLAVHAPGADLIEAHLNTDFRPLAIGTSAALESAPIVFVGYGITAKEEGRLDYDDYAGVDVKGKVVFLFRREPHPADPASPFHGPENTKYATFQHKATNAFQHGAVGVLLVNDSEGSDSLLGFNAAGSEPNSNIPFVMLSREFGEKLLAAAGESSLARLETDLNEDLKPRSHALKGLALHEQFTIKPNGIPTKNVVGVLEGAGPHAGETVVIGGHYDHLGHGGIVSGSLAPFSRQIHNGADDNASGTTMVLELARRLGARRDPLPRRVVFIAFSGEERGLLGSRYYVEHPLYPLASTVMMINCDMVGRLNDKNDLTMIGTGTTPGIDVLVAALGKSAGLNVKTIASMTDGFGGSDHESFYNKNVPVLFAFTGIHGDYHKPSDDSDKINYAGMERIADYLELIALDLIRRPERPPFTRLVQAHGAQPAVGRPATTLGIMPDYGHEETDGLKLAGVREGGAAQKAGLKEGDLIKKLGDKPISSIRDYMETMARYHGGETIDVVVNRDGQPVTLKVTVEGNARREAASPHN
jgi:Peptidase family M28/PA domain/PDZ domain